MNDLKLDKKAFEELKLVIFKLLSQKEDLLFGLNAHKVREVVEMQKIEALPDVYRPYVGIVNLRGVPIPILDLSFIFSDNNEKLDLNQEYRLVICEIMGKIIAILAKTKIKMLTVPDSQITPLGFELNTVNSEYLSGLVDTGDSYLFMLNLEVILDELGVFGKDANINYEKKYSGKKVIIVEDSKLFQKKLSRMLEGLGFAVYIAEDGESGLELISNTPDVDIIFSDIEMPKLNGIEMIREIKKKSLFCDKPILFHSSISNTELMKMIDDENLGDYITKFDEKIILSKLEEYF